MIDLKFLFDKQVNVYDVTNNKLIPNEYGQTKAIFYDGVDYLGKKTTVFAYMGIPKTQKPQGGFPAVILVHGGGGCAFYEWVEYWNGKGYVALAFDCCGWQYGGRIHDSKDTAEVNLNGRHVKPDDSGSFVSDNITLKDSWTYYNVASIVLANNVLRNNENVNKDKIAITGISWGGVLTAITSGVDNRFVAFAPIYGTGYLLYSHVYTNKKLTLPINFEKWEQNFDPQTYVKNNIKPLLFTIGMDDSAFSPKNAQLTYSNSKGKVTYSFRKNLPHHHRWQDNEQMIHVSKFIDLHCKNLQMPFEIIEQKLDNNVFSIKVNNQNNVKKVYFNYSNCENDDCMLWKWEQIEAQFINNEIFVKIPNQTKMCFFELSDDNEQEFILSSSIKML